LINSNLTGVDSDTDFDTDTDGPLKSMPFPVDPPLVHGHWGEMINDALADQPVKVRFDPGPEYAVAKRPFQGIPGIARVEGGRLFATWYACRELDGETRDGEGHWNFALLVRSDDDGRNWSQPLLVIDPPGLVRAFDSNLWVDPRGRLWLFWAQSFRQWDGRGGVWAIRCDRPAAESLQWTEPRRLCDGIMMNKPMVRSDEAWLLPMAVWSRPSWREDMADPREDMAQLQFSNVVVSNDNGESFSVLGGADVPDRTADEHMVVELGDGRLWMLVRTRYGIGESFSADGGRTWTPGRDSGLGGVNSRFYLTRLLSGNLLLVNHLPPPEGAGGEQKRGRLTALLSEDDGQTWPHQLSLDDRIPVSYPDGMQSPDGRIDLVHDFDRKGAGEIVHSVLWEEDIRAGQLTHPGARLGAVISSLGRKGKNRPDSGTAEATAQRWDR